MTSNFASFFWEIAIDSDWKCEYSSKQCNGVKAIMRGN